MTKSLTDNIGAWLIILIGFLLRFRQYVFNRSLWLDESYLALNIIHRNFIQLLKPLANAEQAPIGFLWIEKFLTIIFGNSEYVLRFFPFISGVLSLYFFYKLTNNLFPKYVAYAILSFFALLAPLTYYSSELKSYSSDILVTIVLLNFALVLFKKKIHSLKLYILYSLVGAAAIWISYPSVFVVCSIGIVFLFLYLKNQKYLNMRYISLVYLFIALNFILNFLLAIQFSIRDSQLISQWSYRFPPYIFSSKIFYWFNNLFVEFFNINLNLNQTYLLSIGIVFFILGVILVVKKDKRLFFVLSIPIFLTVAATFLHLYIFYQRFVLFLIPLFLLFIGYGIVQVFELTKKMFEFPRVILLGILFILFFLNPIGNAYSLAYSPANNEDVKSLLNYFVAHKKSGDILYLYYASQYAYMYYVPKYHLENQKYIVGVDRTNNLNEYVNDLNKLKGKQRVWILISHDYVSDSLDEASYFLDTLDTIGVRKDSFESDGAGIFLYNL